MMAGLWLGGSVVAIPVPAQAHVLNQQTALRRRAAHQSGLKLATILQVDKTLSKAGIHFDDLKVKNQTSQYLLSRQRGGLTTKYLVQQTADVPGMTVQVVVYRGTQQLDQNFYRLDTVWEQGQLVTVTYTLTNGQVVDLLAK